MVYDRVAGIDQVTFHMIENWNMIICIGAKL